MVELLVVMVIISLVTAFAMPALRSTLFSDQLKATARRLIGFVTEVSQDAVSKQAEYVVNFDMEQNTVSALPLALVSGENDESKEKKEKRLVIPESVKVVDVTSASGGKNAMGTSTLYFSKKGYVDKTAIHLRSDDGRDMTVVLSPFLGVIKVVDSYIDLADERSR